MGSPRPILHLVALTVISASMVAAGLGGIARTQSSAPVLIPRQSVDLRAYDTSQSGARAMSSRGNSTSISLLVHLEPGYSPRGGRRVGTAPGLRQIIVPASGAATTASTVRKLDGVSLVERDTLMRWSSDVAVNGAPADPMSATAWSLPAIGWPTTPKFSSTPTIAVLDSGLETIHPEFAGDIRPGVPKIAATWSTLTDSTAVPDEFGHGTATASVAAALTGNGKGITGVAPASQVMMVKVGGMDGVRVSDAVEGVDWATRNGARVINMSFSTPERSLALRDAVHRAVASGVVVIAAVGNDGCAESGGGNELQYPAGFSHVIGVAASTPSESIACFSNWGSEVDIAAPGTEIAVAVPDSPRNGTLRSPGGYRTADGTSFAAPSVSGAAALILAQNPTWRPEQVRAALMGSARDIGPRGVDPYSGRGLLQIPAALALATAPSVDLNEVNDDIAQARNLPSIRGRLSYTGVLDRANDPSDIRAVRVGKSGTVRVGLSGTGSMKSEVVIWSSRATSTTATGSSARKTMLFRGPKQAKARGLKPGSTVYVQVVTRRGSSGYRISVSST